MQEYIDAALFVLTLKGSRALMEWVGCSTGALSALRGEVERSGGQGHVTGLGAASEA